MNVMRHIAGLRDFLTRLLSPRPRAVPVKAPLPKGAAAIYVEWAIKEGGFQATAWTDRAGTSYVAIKTLNSIGKTTGLYDWHCSDLFITDMVVGFIKSRPLIVHLHISVTVKGLTAVIRLPSGSKLDFKERRFAPWGSGEPCMSITLVPTFDHYAVHSFPTADD